MKYDLARIMRNAWSNFRRHNITFAEALHRAWLSAKARPINDQRIREAAASAGITEPVNTWAGWKSLGREVIHGMKSLFTVDLIYGSRGDGQTYRASFFAESQTN